MKQMKSRVLALQANELAVRALNGCQIIDQTASALGNDYPAYLDGIQRGFANLPYYGDVIYFTTPTLAQIAAIPDLTANDKIAVISVSAPSDTAPAQARKVAIAGLIATATFGNFEQGSDISLNVRLYRGTTNIAQQERRILVIPQNGVNTFAQFAILPALRPPYLRNSSTVGAPGNSPVLLQDRVNSTWYMWPYELDKTNASLPDSLVIIAKNPVGVSQLEVTPLFAHAYTADVLNNALK